MDLYVQYNNSNVPNFVDDTSHQRMPKVILEEQGRLLQEEIDGLLEHQHEDVRKGAPGVPAVEVCGCVPVVREGVW